MIQYLMIKEAFNASVLFPYQHLHLEMRLPNFLFHYFLYRSPSLVERVTLTVYCRDTQTYNNTKH